MLPELLIKGLPALLSAGAHFLGKGESRDLQLKRLEHEKDLQALRLKFQAAQSKETELFQTIEAERNHITQKETLLLQQNFSREQSILQQMQVRENLLLQLELQRKNQLEIKQLDAELSRELKRLERENALKMIRENRKNAINPLVNHVEDLLLGDLLKQVPLHIFFAPPTVRGDKSSTDSTLKLDENDLARMLREFLDDFSAQERPVIFHGGGWHTRAVHSEQAARSIFRDLKSEASIILETFVEGNTYHIHVAFWAENWTGVRYKSLFSFDWMEVCRGFAKSNTLKMQHKNWTEQKFVRYYGKAAFENYKKNLDLIELEQEARLDEMDEADIKRNISSKYIINQEDRDALIQYIKLHHAFAVGVLIDEYYWLHASPEYRRPPLLPQLLPKLLGAYALPSVQKEHLLKQLAHFYAHLYDLRQQEAEIQLPEHYLELADMYIQLEALEKAREALEQAASILLQNRCIPSSQPVENTGLSFLTREMALPYLRVADADFLSALAKRMRCIPVLKADAEVLLQANDIEKAAIQQALNLYDTLRTQSNVTPQQYEVPFLILDKHQFADAFTARANEVLGYLYQEGLGTSKNTEMAFKLYKKSAEQGFEWGQLGIAELYFEQLEFDKGFIWLQKAIEKGLGIHGHQTLGDCYRDGKGVERNAEKAFENYVKSAELGNHWGYFCMGVFLQEGTETIPQDWKQAEKMFEEAKKRGNTHAERRLEELKQVKQKTKRPQLKSHEPEMILVEGAYFETITIDNNILIVTLNDYYISKYPVTFEFYDLFCEATKRLKPYDENWGRGNRPVIHVDWHEAVAYCDWLTATTGHRYRLPTDAEWEYAARGGKQSKGFIYSGSDDLDNVGWHYENSDNKTQIVGQKSANELGIYDMSGNVREWCQERFQEDTRLVRGGSWCFDPRYCRINVRNHFNASLKDNFIGFRLAADT